MKTIGTLKRRSPNAGRVRGMRMVAAAAVIVLSAAGPALAQSGNGLSRQDLPPGPPVTNPAPPERIGTALHSPAVQPSQKPGQSAFSGVIRPPSGVDPAVQAPVPRSQSGVTPVIPPAGTPGGNPNVQPR